MRKAGALLRRLRSDFATAYLAVVIGCSIASFKKTDCFVDGVDDTCDAASLSDALNQVGLFLRNFASFAFNLKRDEASSRGASDNIRDTSFSIFEEDGFVFSDGTAGGMMFEADILFYAEILDNRVLNVLLCFPHLSI